MGSIRDSEITRLKIINSAGKLFAEKSFKKVSVREIISSAKTHLSALNYHFGSKELLYKEVILEAIKRISTPNHKKKYLLSLPPHQALFEISKQLLLNYRTHSDENWPFVLILREYWEPSNAFEIVSKTYFEPEHDFLCSIISRAIKKPKDDKNVQFAAISFIGLLETFGFYDHIIDKCSPGLIKYGHNNDWFVKKITETILYSAAKE